MKFQFPRMIPTISGVHSARGDTDGCPDDALLTDDLLPRLLHSQA
jgi:hypothetical protein